MVFTTSKSQINYLVKKVVLTILLKKVANFCFQILIAVLYHCMFKYVLFFSPDETLEQGRNASR